MSNPFNYDYSKELYQPLTKYQALKLAAALVVSPHIEADEDSRFAEDYIDELFGVAEQILEKDANLINAVLKADKQLAYDEIMIERQNR